MGIYRLYSGDDGHSHLEELQIAEHPGLSEAVAVSTITFREWEAGHFIDWHPAPRKQYIITLAGNVEIGLGDGTVYTLGPGDMMLAEDTTGQGHTTKAVGNETRVSVAIPLA
jgi:hypothetical protein